MVRDGCGQPGHADWSAMLTLKLPVSQELVDEMN